MRKYIVGICISFIGLLACNKDEEIIIGNPDDNQEQPGNPSQPGQPGDSGDNDPDSSSPLYEVIEYVPAPGQYINDKVTGFANITSQSEACVQVRNRLSQNQFVSLGAWGGYIVVKFNKPIKNNDSYDFSISSNSFDSSSEPGIVWVMKDVNKNGIPDDEWYELKGSHFGKEGYERNYWVTYYRPVEKENTPWEDSNGETGYVNYMGGYHSQDFYYPEWIKDDSYTLYGSKLPLQAIQDPETGMWTNLPFEWGYVDNFGEDFFMDGMMNKFRISDAIDRDNQEVDLEEIDFVKVQTAINGSAGWLGEISTEICGFFVD